MHQPMQGAGAMLPASPAEKWVSVDELADYLQLTPRTVRRLAGDGTLPSLKVGRQFRFLVSSVVEKLEGDAQKETRGQAGSK